MALTTRLTNNYATWVRQPRWQLYGGNAQCEMATVTHSLERIYKTFTLTIAATDSQLTVKGKRIVGDIGALVVSTIKLIKPDTSEVTLYTGSGEQAWELLLDAEDITAHLNQVGTYTLELWGEVEKDETSSQVHYWDVLLAIEEPVPVQVTGLVALPASTQQISCTWNAAAGASSYTIYYKKITDSVWSHITGITGLYVLLGELTSAQMYDIKVAGVNDSGEGTASTTVQQRPLGILTQNLTDNVLPTESFADNRIVQLVLSEQVDITEVFDTQRIVTNPVGTAILLCGIASSQVYTFEPSMPFGTYDTPDVDFGYPDKDKTIKEIRFGCEAKVPHTVIVYISTDGGVTWLLIGSDTTGIGKTGYVYPWLTSKRFIVRFSGNGLSLYFYELYAIPSGWSVKTP